MFVLATLWATAPALGGAGAPPAQAQTEQRDQTQVRIIEVTGLIDPINVDFMSRAVEESEAEQVAALVVRLDSSGAVAPPGELRDLASRIERSSVPVAIWIGPGRQARAGGGALALFNAAPVRGMAPGSQAGGLTAEAALAQKVATVSAATLGDFIIGIDGHPLPGGGEVDIPTTVVRRPGRPPQQQLAPSARARFDEPSLLAQTLHAVATPSAAYLLLSVGLLLVVFEFFTAGIGVAAFVAASSLVLAAYGLGVLPTRPGALALVVLGVVGYGVDVQAGAPRAWTLIGTGAFVVGSFFLFEGLSVPLVVMALVVAGVVLFMVAGMPAMIRTRFSTPTIGRASMLGEEGLAVSDVDPDGVVTVRDAPWRARTNRATPIRAGQPIRVASIDGLVLEVEPTEGAARDAGH
ncbi:MAG: hypothetical protein KY454_12580 [Actinobacteria bacterium]|nr:hypothetical protein [Actinomycetota bacterium]MBW3651653.1 hypothetical protein [Actinomycetota bacterium]